MSTTSQLPPISSRMRIFDLFSGQQEELRSLIQSAADHQNASGLFGPIYTITHELVVNALKAVYKKVFYEKFIVEMGLDDINYEQWLQLFKSEIEAHNAENFSRLVRETDQGVEIMVRSDPAGLKIMVTNLGRPSDIEMSRIQNSLKVSREAENFSSVLETMFADENREGASLGIPLIIISLRKMGADEASFQIRARGNRTFARFKIPRSVLEKSIQEEELA